MLRKMFPQLQEGTRQSTSDPSQDDNDHDSSIEPGVEAENVSFASSQNPGPSSVSPPPASGQAYQPVLSSDRFVQKNYWMPDGHCKTCFECNAKFGIFRRRHHCRFCGRIFCFQCSNHLLDGHSIGQPGMQRACLFCATSRALSSENRNVEVRKFSLSGDFSPEYNIDNLSRTCSPLQNTNTALTNFTGPRVFSVDPTNDPLLPHSSRSSQSANQLTLNLPALPGGEGCKRMVEWDRPQAPQWHLLSRLESTASSAVNAMSVRTWHPVRQEQRADITKLFPNQEEGDTNRLPCGSRYRPNSDSLSGGLRRLSQNQLQSQQPAVRPSSSISLQTFLTLWLKISSCSSATDLSTSALTNPGACMIDQRTLPSPTSGSFLSRLSNFFKSSEASQSSELTVVPSKQEMGSARSSTLLPLRLVRVGSARCAFGSDIVTWLLENSDGALSCREEAKALCQAYTRASFLVPRPPAAAGMFEDNSTLFEIKELDDDSPRSSTIVAHRFSSAGFEGETSSTLCESLTPVRVPSGPIEPAWLTGINVLRGVPASQPLKRRFSADIKSTYPSKDHLSKFTILEETPSATELKTTPHTERIVKMSPGSRSHKSAPNVTTAFAQENELQSLLHEHIMQLIRQDVYDCQVPSEWASTIYDLALMLSTQFKLDLRPVVTSNLLNRKNAQSGTAAHLPLIEDAALFEFYQNKYTPMNILRYVQIKKVIQTADEPCEILDGVAFTGQAINKFLPTELRQPRILIIASSISYERNLFRMTSLEAHSMQEEEYLVNRVGKILAFRPTLLFVEGSISNTALDMFIKTGICLFCNIKRHVLERISRATGAPIVASIDTLLSGSFDCGPKTTSPIGHCQWYKVITVSQPDGTMKPLTLLGTKPPTIPNDTALHGDSRVRWFRFRPLDVDVPAEQTDASLRLPAYSVILRGKDLASLKIVKRCLKFALLAFYNGQLELAFMRDAGILPSSTASSLRSQHTAQPPKDLEDCPSSMAFHMVNRVFTFSAFTRTNLPFLAGSSGRSAPLWDFYSYLVEWPAGRRLNDVLKQKALVIRAKLYALRKRPSVHTLPAAKLSTTGQLPAAFCRLKLEPHLSPSLRLLRCRGGGGRLASDSVDVIGSNSAPVSGPTLACLSKRDAQAFSATRATAFLHRECGSNHPVFKRTWSGLGQWIVQNRVGASSSTNLNFQLVKPNQKTYNRRLRRSVRDARSYASLSLARTVFSTNSVLWPEPCIPTWIISIDFYGSNDLPLGLFLERFCFRSQTCLNRECDTSMLQHIQRFTQTSGSVELVLRHLDSVLPAADLTNHPDHTQIYMWTACSACATSSQACLMSVSSWHLSFIKFIDLLLNSTEVLTHISPNRPSLEDQKPGPVAVQSSSEQTNQPHECSARSLQHFFALGKHLATFSYTTVSIYEVVMPPVEILMFSPQLEPAMAAAYARHIGATVKSPPTTATTNSTQGDPPPLLAKPDTLHALELPAYLRQEAYVVLKKFYQVTTSVKSHLFTLRHETMSDDCLSLVKTLEDHLNWECGKSEIEIRVEILAHLTDTSTPRESAPPPPSEVRESSFEVPIDPALEAVSSLNAIDKVAFSPPEDVVTENTVTVSPSSSPTTVFSSQSSTAPASCMTSPLTGARQSPFPSVNYSYNSCRNTDPQPCCEDNSVRHWDVDPTLAWKSRLDSLTLEEKIVLLLFLLNALKRWIFRFVQDWNTRLAEYNSTVKHLEKRVREGKKRSSALPAGLSSTSIAFSLPASSNPTKKHQRPSGVEGDTPQTTPSSNAIQASHKALEGSKCDPTTTAVSTTASVVTATHADATTSVLTVSSNSAGGGGGGGSVASTTVSGVLRLLTSIRPGNEELKVCPDPWPASEHPQLTALTLVSPTALLAAADSTAGVNEASTELPALSDDSYNRLLDVRPPPSPQPSLTSSSSADETTSRILSSSYAAMAISRSELTQTAEFPFLHAYHDSQSISLLVSELLKVPLLSSTPDVYVNDAEFTSIIAYALICETYTNQLLSLLKPAEPDRSLKVSNRQPGGDTIEVGGKQSVSPFSSPRLSKIFRRKTDSTVESSPQEATSVNDADRHSQTLLASKVTDQFQTRQSTKMGASTAKAPSARIGIQNDRVSFQTDSSVTDSSLCESHFDAPAASTMTVPNTKAPAPEKVVTALAQNPHIEIQYSDASTHFFVRVYYAVEFFNLRKLLFPQGENAFIWSLMRCQSWEARGGKSGSDFMKTRDERFVVKEVSAVEMRTFHEVHQQYFDHLMSAALENRLSVLARIVGLFHVGFKNSATGEARRMDVLVMENLFHNRPGITQIYDLKGSLRGRLITKSGSSLSRSLAVDINNSSNSCSTAPTSENHLVAASSSATGPANPTKLSSLANGDAVVALPPSKVPVLLDQNFINHALENPIYLRLHSKNALMHCLNLDTLFLSELFIMDYSLLVGIDPSTGHMIVGIIDYLRKFTLNKRLEMLVKQTITSAQGPMPTIITPEDYRERLLDQMDRNFQLVPDQWYDSLVDHTETWRISANTPPKSVP